MDSNKQHTICNREYGVDLFRILCCFFITTIHLIGYSNILECTDLTSANHYFIYLIQALNKIGTSGFIFISGYYLSTKQGNNLKKIISFVMEVEFISIIILIISLCIFRRVSLGGLLHSLLPLISQHYWFPFNYIVLLVLSPYINKLHNNLTNREHFSLIIKLILITNFFLKFNPFYNSSVFLGHYSHSILWWITLYIVAAYFKKTDHLNRFDQLAPILFLICVLTQFLMIIGINRYIHSNTERFIEMIEDNSIICLLETVSAFSIFKRISFKDQSWIIRLIKTITPSCFIVYLFQEHDLVRNELWSFVNIEQFASTPTWFLSMIIILVFAGILISSIVLYYLYYLFAKLFINKFNQHIERTIRTIFANNICKKNCKRLITGCLP